MGEMVKAIKELKDGKAPGGDGIQAEVWKYGGAILSNKLHRWINQIWECGHVPQSWKDASIVAIYKKRIEHNVVYLVFRSQNELCSDPTEQTQCSFRSNLSTVDMIFCLQQLQENCIEQDRLLYMAFVDLTKAFDTVGRYELWQLLRKYGCSEKFTTMLESLHIGIMGYVWNGGGGGGLGYICYNKLAPTLFSIFISVMLEEDFRDMGERISAGEDTF